MLDAEFQKYILTFKAVLLIILNCLLVSDFFKLILWHSKNLNAIGFFISMAAAIIGNYLQTEIALYDFKNKIN